MIDENTQRERRNSVADAALTVMLREGIEGAGLRAIAREADCTTGLLTHYFKDLRSVIEYALDRNTVRFFAALDSQLDRARNGRDQLVAMMRYLAQAGDPVSTGVMFRSLASAQLDNRIAERLRVAYARLHVMACEAIARGRSDGSLKGTHPVEDVADLAVALADGIYVAGVARPANLPEDRRDALILAFLSTSEGPFGQPEESSAPGTQR
ncbi:MAG: TetR/AcrR family transcriptional regulator [Alphaproteobacteria bacterium]